MTIQAHYAHPFGVQFSHQRAFLACPSGLAAGTYYFTIESAWGDNIKANETVCFTTTQAVPTGGCVAGCYGAQNTPKANWKVYTYDADRKTILDNALAVSGVANGTSLGIMKLNTRSGNLNSAQEMAYGWNRWKTSALRQYLNSSATKGNWWTPQDQWDIAPEQLSTKDGFLCGMPEELLAAIKPTRIVTYPNTVQDDTTGSAPDVTYDKVFIPSLEQIYVNPQIQGEGDAWEYWKRVAGSTTSLSQFVTYPQMITYAVENITSAQNIRLRSAYRGNAHSTWNVNQIGSISYGGHDSSSAFRFSPVCVIC